MKRMILAAATCLLAIPVAMATDDFNTTIQNMKDSNTTTDFDALYHKYAELTPEYKANLAKLKSAAKQVADTNYQQFKAALDTYKSPYSYKVAQADEKYKTQLEDLKEAYRSQTKDKSDESVAKARIDDVRRQVDEDYQKYGGSLVVDAKTEMYADDPAALKFRNDPLYKDLYLRRINGDNAYYRDIAQKGSEIRVIHDKSFGDRLLDWFGSVASKSKHDLEQLVADGTVNKRASIEHKKQEREELLSFARDAKNRGDSDLSDEYFKAAHAQEIQTTPEDEAFLRSEKNHQLDQIKQEMCSNCRTDTSQCSDYAWFCSQQW